MLFKRQVLIIFLFIFIIPIISFASEKYGEGSKDKDVTEDNLLLFDENTPRFGNFSFDIDEAKQLKPKKNDFKMLHFAPMSNKLGERWVLITVKNMSTGRRFLKSEYIVATFVNGEQGNPVNLEESVDGGEIFSKTIFFGISKFPIVMLEM